jgi:hypothetical protein
MLVSGMNSRTTYSLPFNLAINPVQNFSGYNSSRFTLFRFPSDLTPAFATLLLRASRSTQTPEVYTHNSHFRANPNLSSAVSVSNPFSLLARHPIACYRPSHSPTLLHHPKNRPFIFNSLRTLLLFEGGGGTGGKNRLRILKSSLEPMTSPHRIPDSSDDDYTSHRQITTERQAFHQRINEFL